MIFLFDFTLFVIDIHHIILISLFSAPFDHFHFHPTLGLDPALILALRHKSFDVTRPFPRLVMIGGTSAHFDSKTSTTSHTVAKTMVSTTYLTRYHLISGIFFILVIIDY